MDKKLDGFLAKWEKKLQETTSLYAKLERDEKDPMFRSEEKYTGFVKWMRVGSGATAQNLVLLEMNDVGKQELHEKVIWTGTMVYQFSPADKKIYVIRIEKPKVDQVRQDSFWSLFVQGFFPTSFFQENIVSLVFFADTTKLRDRYHLKLSHDANHPNGEDKDHIYVDIVPKATAEKADFLRAQLMLSKENFLPRRLTFDMPAKSELIWNVTSIDDKAKLKPEDFDLPKEPPGWKLIQVDDKK
jgi:TIGR03009 family protein